MKVFAVGASRNIGYYSSLSLLKQGHSVCFLLRKATAFDEDVDMKPFVDSGHAVLIQGDALKAEDVQKAWDQASSDAPVDLILFSVGGYPNFKLTKGFVLDPPDLCTACLLNTFAAIHLSQPPPKVIVISSNGITPASHRDLPFLVKPVYAMIGAPHADKLGMERICSYSAGWTWPEEDKVKPEVLGDGWEKKLGRSEGWLKSVVVVRPALLTDGAETGKYRVGEAEKSLYTISRRDVAHFVVNDVLSNWEKYEGKAFNIGY